MALGLVLGRALRELASLSRVDARIFVAGTSSLSKWDPWSSSPSPRGFSAMPEAVEPHPEPIDPKLIMSISARTDPFKTYGYMIEKLSEGHRVNMKCTGTSAVHAAAKTLTVARARIKEHSMLQGDDICIRIAFQPEAPTDRISKFTIAVDRVKPELLTESSAREEDVMRPGLRTRPKEMALRLGGAMLNGKNPLAKAMGPIPVATMMAGYALARKKLVGKQEHDLLCFPEYRTEKVKTKGEMADRVVMNLMFRQVPFDASMDVDKNIGFGEYVSDDSRKQKAGSEKKSEVEKPQGDETGVATKEPQEAETAMANEPHEDEATETADATLEMARAEGGEPAGVETESESESDSGEASGDDGPSNNLDDTESEDSEKPRKE